jgi:hypothetical protein
LKPFLGETMVVYRVEKDRVGPYRSHQVDLQRMYDAHNLARLHPTPQVDCGKAPELNEVCGFKSIQDLQKRFYGFRTSLRKLGFKVNVYETEPTAIGNKQLLFKDRESRLIKTLVLK